MLLVVLFKLTKSLGQAIDVDVADAPSPSPITVLARASRFSNTSPLVATVLVASDGLVSEEGLGEMRSTVIFSLFECGRISATITLNGLFY